MSGPDFPENSAADHSSADEERNKSRKFIGVAASCLILIACLAYVSHLFSGHPFSVFDFSGLILFLLFIVIVDRIVVPHMSGLGESHHLTENFPEHQKQIKTLLGGLADDWVVVHQVNAGNGVIDHLIFRKDGAVFLVNCPADGELRIGKKFAQGAGGDLIQCALWLRNLLKARLGFEPWIHAAWVTSDTASQRSSRGGGFNTVAASSLLQWMNESPGDTRTAAALWPQVEQLKSELSRPASIHLAPLVDLR